MPSENWEEPSLDDVIERFRSHDAANFFSRFPGARQEFFSNSNTRGEAAVLVPLFCDQDHWRIMMTVRANHLRSQAGQVAFPGGKVDDKDFDLRTTALRETHEEIGLPPNQVHVISQLPPVIAPTRHLVTPFVGIIPSAFAPTIDAAEVAETFTTRARVFLQREHYNGKWITWKNKPFLLHSFEVAPQQLARSPVMGMSAILAMVTAAVLYNRKPSFDTDIALDFTDGASDLSRVVHDIYFNKDKHYLKKE